MWTFFVFCYYPTNVKLLLLAVACGLPIPPLPLGVRSGQVYNRSHHVWRRRNAKRRARFFFDEKILYSTHVGYIVWIRNELGRSLLLLLFWRWGRTEQLLLWFFSLGLGQYVAKLILIDLTTCWSWQSSTFWLTWPSITRILDGQTNTSSSKVGDILMQMQEESYMFGLKASIRRR